MGWAGAALSIVSIGIQIYQMVKGPKGNKAEGARLEDTKIMISTLGTPIPVGYGTTRMSGNMIWAEDIKEVKTKESVGKGGSKVTTFAYYRSFAIGLAEPAGLTPRLLKIFADGKLIYDATGTGLFQKRNVRVTFYEGSETQDVDPIIEASVGTDDTPAFRGHCYAVFDELPMGDYGNRVPNLTFVITFEGTDDHTITTSPQTLNADRGWLYSRRFQRAYLIQSGDVSGDIDVYEWNLVTNDIRKVTSTLPYPATALTSGQNQFFDGMTIDNLGNIYIGTQFGAGNYGSLTKIDPISLQAIDTVDLDTGANEGPQALLFYENPNWSPSGSGALDVTDSIGNEFVLCSFDDGTFVWVRVEFGDLSIVGSRFLPWGGQSGAEKGAIQMIETKDYEIITIQGRITTAVTEERHLNRIVPGQPPNAPGPGGNAFTSIYDGTAVIQSMRYMAYDRANEGLIVWNDTDDNAQDLPDGQGFVRFDVNDWPPTPTAQKSEFVDGLVNPGLQRLRNSIDNGRIIWVGDDDDTDNIYWIDSVSLAVLRLRDSDDWGATVAAGLIHSGMWDVDGNSWLQLTTGPENISRMFFDRSSGSSMDLDKVIADLCARAGIPAADIDVTDLAPGVDARSNVRGYMLTQRSSAAAAIEQLMAAYFFDAVESDFILKFRRRAGSVIDTGITIPETDLGVDEDKPGENLVEIQYAQPSEIPIKYEVKFMDANADYQEGAAPAQRSQSPLRPALGSHAQVVDLPMVFTPTEAKRIAERFLFAAATESAEMAVHTFPKHLALDPTDTVTVIADGRSFAVRIESTSIGESFDVSLKAIITDKEVFASSATEGQETEGIPDQTIRGNVTAKMYPIDSNLFHDQGEGGAGIPIYFAMLPNAATGWRGGRIFGSTSNQEYHPVVTYRDGTTGGVAISELPDVASWTTWDRTSVLTVAIQFGTLSSTTEALALSDGTNAALVGGEIIQFVTATNNGDGTYDLSTLIRGRRGTNWAVPLHNTGERFILLDTTVRKVITDLAALGSTRFYRGASVGEPITNTPVQTLLIEGKALRPYSGVAPKRILDASNDAWITWLRRTRIGGDGDWLDGISDTETGEGTLDFEVDLVDAVDSSVVSATKQSTVTELKTKGAISVAADTPTAGKSRLTLSGGTFSADGYVDGQVVRCEAFTEFGNRGSFEVDAVGSTTIDLINPDGVTESAGSDKILIRPTEQVRFTAAEQTAAGYSAGADLTVKIYQRSVTVGRGFPLEATV